MGHDPCKKILFTVVFLVVVAKRRRCPMLWLCVCLVVVCRSHSQDHGVHIHTDVHVGVTVFAH